MGDEVAAEVAANLDRMRWLSERIGDAATALYDGHTQRYSPGEVPQWVFESFPIPEEAFGNTSGGPACYSEWTNAKEAFGAACVNVWKVLHSDVARLSQVIAAFETMDDETADRIAASNRMTFISAHTHSGGSLEDDFIRGQQNHRLVDIADGIGTPTVVGADLNENLGANFRSLDGSDDLSDELRGQDNYSARSIASFDDHGYADIGPAGPTSSDGTGQPIDHMRARGVTAEDARIVDGGPSDHHGQAADVPVPWW